MSGGDMIETVTMEKSTFASGPQKFEAGTPKIAEAIGFAAAAEYLSQFDMDELHTHIRGLAMYTASELKSLPGITVYGDHSVSEGSGVVSFLHDTVHAEDLARFMDAGGFAMRTGHHCANPCWMRMASQVPTVCHSIFTTQWGKRRLLSNICEPSLRNSVR